MFPLDISQHPKLIIMAVLRHFLASAYPHIPKDKFRELEDLVDKIANYLADLEKIKAAQKALEESYEPPTTN